MYNVPEKTKNKSEIEKKRRLFINLRSVFNLKIHISDL